MVAVPGMTVVEPADPVALAGVVPQLFDKYGNVYLRCARQLVPQIYEEGTDFTVGKANVLREGTDVTLVACGIMSVSYTHLAAPREARAVPAGHG